MDVGYHMRYRKHGRHKDSPPYLLGLFCLIPLVGAFAGLGLLFYGIFKYKDRVLIIIGATGILITVVVYATLFYFANNSRLAKNGFAELSQLQLNKLVQSVEFYKEQHGRYPDNVKQLKAANKTVIIEDPVRGAKIGQPLYFNYKRLGDKYILYSSGPDEIAGTADDLFPQPADTSATGLIRK